MKIACGFDHAGVPLRETVVTALQSAGHDPDDVGTADDYPDIALAVCRAVIEGKADRGVVVCGSGAGVLDILMPELSSLELLLRLIRL